MALSNNEKMLLILERISQLHINKILRLKGFIVEKDESKRPLEILIYKGFSSCTTHSTDFDLDKPTLPRNANLIEAELLLAPMNPSQDKIVRGPLKIEEFLKESNWL